MDCAEGFSMTRNYGISRRETSFGGGYGKPPGSHSRDIYAPRDLNPLPAQSILHSEDISYPTLDIGGLIRDVILGTITAVALVASIFILLFVET